MTEGAKKFYTRSRRVLLILAFELSPAPELSRKQCFLPQTSSLFRRNALQSLGSGKELHGHLEAQL